MSSTGPIKFGMFVMPQHPRSDDPVRRFRSLLMPAGWTGRSADAAPGALFTFSI